jgi:hypothetical protein
MAYLREDETRRLLIVANYQSTPQTYFFDGTLLSVLLTNDGDAVISGNELHLGGYQAVLLELQK